MTIAISIMAFLIGAAVGVIGLAVISAMVVGGRSDRSDRRGDDGKS